MDDAKIFRALRDDLARIYSQTLSTIDMVRGLKSGHPRMVDFFDRVLELFIEAEVLKGTTKKENEIKQHAAASLYAFFDEALNYSHHLDEFILAFAWFLVEISTGESRFSIEWSTWVFEPGDVNTLVVEFEEFEGSSPRVAAGRDFGFEDVEKLHYSLDKLIEKEREYASSLANRSND